MYCNHCRFYVTFYMWSHSKKDKACPRCFMAKYETFVRPEPGEEVEDDDMDFEEEI